jgi:hypothetical protein
MSPGVTQNPKHPSQAGRKWPGLDNQNSTASNRVTEEAALLTAHYPAFFSRGGTGFLFLCHLRMYENTQKSSEPRFLI